MITTISQGRQITIPSHLREKYKFLPGTRIDIEDTNKGILLKPIEKSGWDSIGEQAKKYPNKLSNEEMDKLEDDIYE
tara:strand:- start:8950 stop:9180 length:231 start_codon:yes stop_codon:yes gene_type:complete